MGASQVIILTFLDPLALEATLNASTVKMIGSVEDAIGDLEERGIVSHNRLRIVRNFQMKQIMVAKKTKQKLKPKWPRVPGHWPSLLTIHHVCGVTRLPLKYVSFLSDTVPNQNTVYDES